MGENDTKTINVDADLFKNGAKQLRFCLKNWISVDRASGERFRMAPFSVIVYSVVVWMIAVSGAKQLRFHLKTDKYGQGLRFLLGSEFEINSR